MKVFIISNRNSENNIEVIVGNITTIILIRVVEGWKYDAHLSNNYPKGRRK